MAEFYASKPGPITPIALVGHNVGIWIGSTWNGYRIAYLEGYPKSRPLVFDAGALAVAGVRSNFDLTTLQLAQTPPEMLQLRLYVIDDIEVTLKHGQSDFRFKSGNRQLSVDLFSRQQDPCGHETEFMVLKTEEPQLDVLNPTGYAIALSRTAFYGFRFMLDDLKVSSSSPQGLEELVKGPITFVSAGGK